MRRRRPYWLKCNVCLKQYKQVPAWIDHQSRCHVRIAASIMLFIMGEDTRSYVNDRDWLEHAFKTGKMRSY